MFAPVIRAAAPVAVPFMKEVAVEGAKAVGHTIVVYVSLGIVIGAGYMAYKAGSAAIDLAGRGTSVAMNRARAMFENSPAPIVDADEFETATDNLA